MLTQSERNDIIAQMAELPASVWKVRQRPQNYQDLVLAAKAELRNKFDELMERADNILALFRDFDAVEDWRDTPPPLYKDVIDFGDTEHLRRFNELIENWPDVKGQPGEGYW